MKRTLPLLMFILMLPLLGRIAAALLSLFGAAETMLRAAGAVNETAGFTSIAAKSVATAVSVAAGCAAAALLAYLARAIRSG